MLETNLRNKSVQSRIGKALISCRSSRISVLKKAHFQTIYPQSSSNSFSFCLKFPHNSNACFELFLTHFFSSAGGLHAAKSASEKPMALPTREPYSSLIRKKCLSTLFWMSRLTVPSPAAIFSTQCCLCVSSKTVWKSSLGCS